MRVRCACGWETSGEEETVVAATQDHGRKLHNMEASRDQVVAMAIADRDADAKAVEGPPA
jgi:predicted small metal-binding protein